MLSACLLTLGCNNVPDGPRTVPAKGVITLDGEPVEGAAIVFIGPSTSAKALSDAKGRFSLNAFEYKSGAEPGVYKMVCTKTIEYTDNSAPNSEEAQHAGESAGAMIKDAFDGRYNNLTEAAEFTIPENGTSDLKLELTSK